MPEPILQKVVKLVISNSTARSGSHRPHSRRLIPFVMLLISQSAQQAGNLARPAAFTPPASENEQIEVLAHLVGVFGLYFHPICTSGVGLVHSIDLLHNQAFTPEVSPACASLTYLVSRMRSSMARMSLPFLPNRSSANSSRPA